MSDTPFHPFGRNGPAVLEALISEKLGIRRMPGAELAGCDELAGFTINMERWKAVEEQRGLGSAPREVWVSRRSLVVQVYDEDRGATRLSISYPRTNSSPRDWRFLQNLKNIVMGEDREAVELFPPEADVIQISNMTHLWVLPKGQMLKIGWHKVVAQCPAPSGPTPAEPACFDGQEGR